MNEKLRMIAEHDQHLAVIQEIFSKLSPAQLQDVISAVNEQTLHVTLTKRD